MLDAHAHATRGDAVSDFVLNINMDQKCVECSKGGATNSGLCLKCINRAANLKIVMRSHAGRVMQQRWRDIAKSGGTP